MGTIIGFDAEGRRIPGHRIRRCVVARWRTPDHKSREKRFDRKMTPRSI